MKALYRLQESKILWLVLRIWLNDLSSNLTALCTRINLLNDATHSEQLKTSTTCIGKSLSFIRKYIGCPGRIRKARPSSSSEWNAWVRLLEPVKGGVGRKSPLLTPLCWVLPYLDAINLKLPPPSSFGALRPTPFTFVWASNYNGCGRFNRFTLYRPFSPCPRFDLS